MTVVAAVSTPTGARGENAEWTAKSGDVRVVCPLTIGGSFEAKTTALTGSLRPTEPAEGQFVVDLDTLDTGIGLRTNHLRRTYLETDKGAEYAHAVLSRIRLDGVSTETLTGRGAFSGMLRLHGVEKPVSGQVELQRSGSSVRVRAVFPVVLAQFDIQKPQYLGVGVKDEVVVHATFDAVTR